MAHGGLRLKLLKELLAGAYVADTQFIPSDIGYFAASLRFEQVMQLGHGLLVMPEEVPRKKALASSIERSEILTKALPY